MRALRLGQIWITAMTITAGLLSFNASASNTPSLSSRFGPSELTGRTERWIDRYSGQFQRSFSIRLKSHLRALLLSEDSIEFLLGLVNRQAVTGGRLLEDYLEDYVHFISWQSTRRLPGGYISDYTTTLEKIASLKDERVCRELLDHRSTPQHSKPSEYFLALSRLSKEDQETLMSLVALGFRRLSSGAYPGPRVGEAILDSSLTDYQLFMQSAGSGGRSDCQSLGLTILWMNQPTPQEQSIRLTRFTLWANGQLRPVMR
jgi:hypothetical protein